MLFSFKDSGNPCIRCYDVYRVRDFFDLFAVYCMKHGAFAHVNDFDVIVTMLWKIDESKTQLFVFMFE